MPAMFVSAADVVYELSEQHMNPKGSNTQLLENIK
jgi:hypothetical protein